MILHWEQIVLHYGEMGEAFIRSHQMKFEKAHQSTYGILYSPVCIDECEIMSSGGVHAEEKLLNTDTWKIQIPEALARFNSAYNNKFNVILGLNRTPCGNCTQLLVKAINKLHNQFPLRTSQNRFILASLGAYRPNETRSVNNRTTVGNLSALKNAGWELCVLQTGARLTANGIMLQSVLENMGLRGIMRLDS